MTIMSLWHFVKTYFRHRHQAFESYQMEYLNFNQNSKYSKYCLVFFYNLSKLYVR